MIHCICNNISEKEIKEILDLVEIFTYDELFEELNVLPCCGSCEEDIQKIIDQSKL